MIPNNEKKEGTEPFAQMKMMMTTMKTWVRRHWTARYANFIFGIAKSLFINVKSSFITTTTTKTTAAQRAKRPVAGKHTYIPIFFKIVLSSLISNGILKSNITSVRSRDMSHWITADAFVLTTMNGNGILSSGNFVTWLFLNTKFRKQTCCVNNSFSASFLCRSWYRRYSISCCNASRSCLSAVGKPLQVISFFSLEMMSIAIKTFSASYTRRRMFFSSNLPFGSSFLRSAMTFLTSSSATSLYVVVPFSSTF